MHHRFSEVQILWRLITKKAKNVLPEFAPHTKIMQVPPLYYCSASFLCEK